MRGEKVKFIIISCTSSLTYVAPYENATLSTSDITKISYPFYLYVYENARTRKNNKHGRKI